MHKRYYKDYYNNSDFKIETEEGMTIVKAYNPISNSNLLSAQNEPIVAISTAMHNFFLETLYPRVITGVGLNHEAGVEGEFKLGMHFDYTHSMPIIYGSSVKGVLKEYFKEFANEFKEFEDVIFGSDKPSAKSIYERDIFSMR